MVWDYPTPFTQPAVPQAGDIDGLNHTNNAVYVQWCEKIGWAHSEALGLDLARVAVAPADLEAELALELGLEVGVDAVADEQGRLAADAGADEPQARRDPDEGPFRRPPPRDACDVREVNVNAAAQAILAALMRRLRPLRPIRFMGTIAFSPMAPPCMNSTL